MQALIHTFRDNPELAIFLTLALGFWLGNLKFGKFSLGVVTSTLLAGVLVGQMRIEISPNVKSVFFLMFLFAVGYAVGPQFFNGLKNDGLQLVGLGVVPSLRFSVLSVASCSNSESPGVNDRSEPHPESRAGDRAVS